MKNFINQKMFTNRVLIAYNKEHTSSFVAEQTQYFNFITITKNCTSMFPVYMKH